MSLRPRFALVLAVPLLAPAAFAIDWEPADRIQSVVEQFVREHSADKGAELRVQADTNVRVPRCASAPSAFAAGSGTSVMTVGLNCSGPVAWQLYVPVRMLAYGEVLVLARPALAGQVLTPDMLRSERRDLALLPAGGVPTIEQAVGQTVRRGLPAGAALSAADLKPQILVKRGQQVTLVGNAGGLQVRAQGRALADAGLDQRVSVENLSSRRQVEGRVRSADTVEVGL